MRLAAFNLENLFDRAKAMNFEDWKEGKPILAKFAKLNALLGEFSYSAAAKREMIKLMIELGLEKSDEGPFVILRRNRGGLLKRPRDGGIEIIADARADWVGSLELRDEPIDENSMRNTARAFGRDPVGPVDARLPEDCRPASQPRSPQAVPLFLRSPRSPVVGKILARWNRQRPLSFRNHLQRHSVLTMRG
jgi:hypothetical protein